MTALPRLPIEEILRGAPGEPSGEPLPGRSRGGREIRAHRAGSGAVRVSLIGGCHADEPVGPWMLERLAAYLASLPSDDPLLSGASWSIVPHVNPDGAARNGAWSRSTVALEDHAGGSDTGFDLASYLAGVVRELPGDDIEFGFPRSAEDREARPENLAVAEFLGRRGPFHLHASFHGMGFAPGPWFLIEHAWADRTVELRDRLRARVGQMGYRVFDVDRGGEKGFHRIDEGFSSRPDSRAMAAHFEAAGEPETASLFRPSSMELARSLGGDPFTFVSEMPLFLLPPGGLPSGSPAGTGGRDRLHAWLDAQIERYGWPGAREPLAALGVAPMPIRDQMRLQLEFLNEGLAAVAGALDP